MQDTQSFQRYTLTKTDKNAKVPLIFFLKDKQLGHSGKFGYKKIIAIKVI